MIAEMPTTVFVISWGRPIYLWCCLDALWRLTRSKARIILLDNFHPDPLMSQVIGGFERRGLFSEIIRFPDNSFDNIKSAYIERLADAGPFHVYLESDAVINCTCGCWLSEMTRIIRANPHIGMLGSLIETGDFVDEPTALRLAGGDARQALFLAKLGSLERRFADSAEWADEGRDYFFAEAPCPIGNPPGRLMMLNTDFMRENGFEPDIALAASFRRRGFRPGSDRPRAPPSLEPSQHFRPCRLRQRAPRQVLLVMNAGARNSLHDRGISLRKARKSDLEDLRRWRNRHRNRFFDTGKISADAQRQWFKEHLKRSNDFLFVICHRRLPVGCIGIRMTGAGWDLYNVIRGRSPGSSAGCMSTALAAVIDRARKIEDVPVWAKVLKGNPAAAWYERNGFRIAAHRKTFLLMKHSNTRATPP